MRNEQHAKPPPDLRNRTRQFALRVIRLCRALPSAPESRLIGNQLLRSATSVGANYRAAKRARSRAEFLAKMETVEEEIDESLYWIDLLAAAGIVQATRLGPLTQEVNELVAIVVASIKTAKARGR